ncbi:serine hydrolase domain-containing protein [Kitasatospora sp. NPDC004289]
MKHTRQRFAAVIGAVAAAAALLTAGTAQAAPAGDHSATLAALKTFQAAAGPGAGIFAGDATGSWQLSVGTSTINTSKPVLADQYFRIGSQSKSFTAATVLALADEGKVALDASVATYLPGVVSGNGHDGTVITVRQLLQHTSGIPSYDPLGSLALAEPDGSFKAATLVREGLKRPPAGAPGTVFSYSNTNYLILGMIVEKVTGLPVHEAVTRRVIQPLGLTRTLFPAPGDRALPAPGIPGYHGARLGPFFFWSPALDYDPSLFGPAGAVISTEQDLATFYRALLNGQVLSPAMTAELLATTPVTSDAYGLGVFRMTLSCGGEAWGHNGGVPGYFSQTVATKDGRYASAMTNVHFTNNTPVQQIFTLLDTALCESHR